MTTTDTTAATESDAARQTRADRNARVIQERRTALIDAAIAYTEHSGMPFQLVYAGEDTAYVECDRRVVTIKPHPTDWLFTSRFDTGDGEMTDLGTYNTFDEAAEAPLPPLADRTLRVTLDVLVIASEPDPAFGEDADAEDASAAILENDLHDLAPEDVADVLATDAGMAERDKFGAHPWDELLSGSAMFVRFGRVSVHDAQWVVPPRFVD